MKALAQRIVAGILSIAFISALFLSPQAFAYSEGAYGSCTYSSKPSDCTKTTTVTTPSGLKVSVNLSNGQVIPLEGYQVVITPLNGQGSSFASADIYIDGKKVATVTPGPNGTATWFWDVATHPGSKITVVVFDNTGKRTNLPFDVSIAQKASEEAPTSPVVPTVPISPTATDEPKGSAGPRSGIGEFFGQAGRSVQNAIEEAIKMLPPALVKAFPYLLFLLILLEILILVYISRREITELKELRKLAEREKQLASMKQKFTGLVSHYLRTPLTVMTGGLEGLSDDQASQTLAQKMLPITSAIHDTIESIVDRTSAEAVGTSSVISKTRTISFLKLLAVWLPVVLIGILALVFIYLARNIDRYDLSATDSMTLSIFYSVLIVGVYVAIRQWTLHKNELAAARDVLTYEQKLHEAQDAVIAEVSGTLLQQEKQLASLVNQTPSGSMYSKFIHDGYDRLESTINRFAIAAALKGTAPGTTFETPLASQLLDNAQKGLLAKRTQKNVSVALSADGEVPVKSAGLLTLVIKSLLDNAINYSNAGQKIDVDMTKSTDSSKLAVTNHGKGLTPDEISTIFEPFNRVEDIEDFDHEGLGFSLYLDKLIMTYLGGDISASSSTREATTFSLTMPVQESA